MKRTGAELEEKGGEREEDEERSPNLVDLVEHHARVVPVPCRSGVLLQDLTPLPVRHASSRFIRTAHPLPVLPTLLFCCSSTHLTHLVVDLGAAAVPRAREPAQVLWDLHVLQESAARVLFPIPAVSMRCPAVCPSTGSLFSYLIEVVAGVDSQVHLALHRLGEDSLHQGPRLQ
eukprot:2782946-Rhodomonas_salina.2